ncbi:16S rRNA (guanine(966)-N(2))-methyltransferase RsmD [soil metagenome]
MSTIFSKSDERTKRSNAKQVGAPRRGKAAAPAKTKARGDGPGSAPREVSIIGGQWKRTKLPVADRPGLRPTPSRVRETLFNWLVHLGGGDMNGWRCLDAYAGTGALGFESASRGAAEVVLLERDPQLLKTLRSIQEKLKADMVKSETADALAWMARSAPNRFDVVFLDPPFDADDLVVPSLKAARRLLANEGLVYLEGPRACNPEAIAALGLAVLRQGRAGAVHFHLLNSIDPVEPAPVDPVSSS